MTTPQDAETTHDELDDDLFLPPDGEESEEDDAVEEPLSVEDQLRADLEKSHAKVAELKDSLLRKAADLQNQRRRHDREKADFRKFATETVLKDVVVVLDDLDRAFGALDGSEVVEKGLIDGVRMVHKKFQSTLEKHGVVKIESLGKQFDPQVHEALQQLDDPSVPNNSVAQEFQCAYTLNGRLLRPALVVVAKGGPEPVIVDSDDDGES